MGLKVIGAGFGRTGTESLKRALEILGFGPCHHMYEVLPNAALYEAWIEVLHGRAEPDWDRLFDGFNSTVDWPSAHYWRELAAHYPEARIVLSVRSPESWYDSMDRTILPRLRAPEEPHGMAAALREVVFGGNVDDRDHVIGLYLRQIDQVQAAFGPDRLLTYDLGAGWEPLCAFLGCAVPDVPYPRGNTTEVFHARSAEARERRTGDKAD